MAQIAGRRNIFRLPVIEVKIKNINHKATEP